MPHQKVVLTGATGAISSLVIDALRERYDLVPVDIKEAGRDGRRIEGIRVLDILRRPEEAREAFRDAFAVVHNGHLWPAEGEDPFETEMANLRLARNVFHLALEEGARRVVVASSNHASDFHESLLLDRKLDVVTPETKPLPHGLYGWTKGAYENLGFVYALGRQFGKPLPNVHLRIGAPRETDLEKVEPGNLRRMRRCLGAYVSARDLSQLYVKSVETEDIDNEWGVPFQIFYGISGNAHRFWSIANAQTKIGYEPKDDSERRFRRHVNRILEGTPAD